MSDDWYAPNEVWQFKAEHICWLLEHLPLLKGGFYPPDPASAMSPGGRQFHAGASFEAAKQLYIELTERLERCGLDGLLLIVREGLGLGEDELGDFLKQPRHKIGKRADTALRYVSGRGRKWMRRGEYEPLTYHEFRHHKKSSDVQT
jgi:hypothetical protein